DLKALLVGMEFERERAVRRFEHCDRFFGVAGRVEDEIDIDLLPPSIGVAKAAGRTEIEPASRDRQDGSGRNLALAQLRISPGGERQAVVENVAGAGEVEIVVLDEIDRGGLVGGGGKIDIEPVAQQRVSD